MQGPGSFSNVPFVIISGPNGYLLVYSPSPGAGFLIASISGTNFSDPYSNAVMAGITSYANFSGTWYAQSQQNGGTVYYTSASYAGPWTQIGQTDYHTFIIPGTTTPVFNVQGGLETETFLAVISNTAGGGECWYAPSGDTTGVTDATIINTLLTSPYAINLLPGTYWVNQPIALPNYAIIRGAGRPPLGTTGMTVIKAAGAANFHSVMCSAGWLGNSGSVATGVNLSGFKIDANNLVSRCLTLQTYDSTVEDCSFENSLFQGIVLDGKNEAGTVPMTTSAVNNRFHRCVFNNNGQYNFLTVNDTTANGVYTDGFLTECDMAGSTIAAISIQFPAGWLVHGNHAYGLDGHGFQMGKMQNTRITSNYIEAWGQGGTGGSWYALDAANTGQTGNGNIVNANIAWLSAAPGNAGSTVDGFAFTCAAASTFRAVVKGNSLYCVPAAGFTAANGIVYTNAAGTSVTEVISDNEVTGNWTNAQVQVPAGGAMGITQTGV